MNATRLMLTLSALLFSVAGHAAPITIMIRLSFQTLSVGLIALASMLAAPSAADASTLTYTATGGIITGTLGGTPFTDATWSITGTADPTNVVSGTTGSPFGPLPFNFLAMTPLLTITTGSSTLQATIVTTGSTGQQVGVFSVDAGAIMSGYSYDGFGYIEGDGSIGQGFGVEGFGLYTDLQSSFFGSGSQSPSNNNLDNLDTNVGVFVVSDYTDQGATFTVSAVPEPSTYAMALAGLACGGYSMWRRRKRA
jgi:hypothetical protein